VNAARAESVTFDDVRAAAGRLTGIAHRTPVLRSRTLDARAGAQALLKAENFQRMGAFKFRGAYNRLAQLTSRSANAASLRSRAAITRRASRWLRSY
jgi:threonine dehydratase